MSANQIVAYNLGRARALRELTQDQAAALLEPFLGVRWSRASFSAAERSTESGRTREFTADEILAFARVFDLPVTWFFLPPGDKPEEGAPPDVTCGGTTAIRAGELLDSIFPHRPGPTEVYERLKSLLVKLPSQQRSSTDDRWFRWTAVRGASILTGVLGDLDRHASNLRSLADLLERGHDVALQTLGEELQNVEATTKGGGSNG
jgi:hypothetical protein